MFVAEMKDPDRPDWDAFVRQSPFGLPYHLSGWQTVLENTYRYETSFLLAKTGAQVVGVLPLFAVRSIFLGSRLTTMPGGLCAESMEVATALLARARQVAQQAGVGQLVLHDTRHLWLTDPPEKAGHVAWLVDVSMGTDALWTKLDKNVRRQVRMARENELSVQIDDTGRLLDDFYRVLSRFVHQAGTPVFSQDFIRQVVTAFPGGFLIAMVYKGSQPIGGYFQLVLGNTVYGAWGSTLREYLELRPVYLAYWEILKDAIRRGYRMVDMGRSPAGSGASAYKKQWAGIAQPIYQQVVRVGSNGSDVSTTERVQTDARLQGFTQLWSRLPYPVAQFLGPRLRRQIPFA